MGTPAFELPLWFHFAATFVFAVTGAIAALRRNYVSVTPSASGGA